MTSETTKIEQLFEQWRTDHHVKNEDIEYLLRLLRINLDDLVLAIMQAGRKRQWSELSRLNRKLEGLALNLNWESLRRLGTFIGNTIEDQHEEHLDALLAKLSKLHKCE